MKDINLIKSRDARYVRIVYFLMLSLGISMVCLADIEGNMPTLSWIGFGLFFFSSGVAAIVASALGRSAQFVKTSKNVNIATAAIAAFFILLFTCIDPSLDPLKGIGFIFLLASALAWLQIGLGLALGTFFRVSNAHTSSAKD